MTLLEATEEAGAPSAAGRVVGICGLLAMTLATVIIGSVKSVKYQASPNKSTKMDVYFAVVHPFLAGCVMYGLYYLCLHPDHHDTTRQLIPVFSFLVAAPDLGSIFSPVFNDVLPSELMYFSPVFAIIVTGLVHWVYYGWLTRNMLWLAITIRGIQMSRVQSFKIAIILLIGYLAYDIFWFYHKSIQETVFYILDAPFSLLFPQDFIEHGANAKVFTGLSFADVLIPGQYMAILLRFDKSMSNTMYPYFLTTLFVYFLSLLAAILLRIQMDFRVRALFYVVPSCVIIPITLAASRKDLDNLFTYEDVDQIKESEIKSKEETPQLDSNINTKEDGEPLERKETQVALAEPVDEQPRLRTKAKEVFSDNIIKADHSYEEPSRVMLPLDNVRQNRWSDSTAESDEMPRPPSMLCRDCQYELWYKAKTEAAKKQPLCRDCEDDLIQTHHRPVGRANWRDNMITYDNRSFRPSNNSNLDEDDGERRAAAQEQTARSPRHESDYKWKRETGEEDDGLLYDIKYRQEQNNEAIRRGSRHRKEAHQRSPRRRIDSECLESNDSFEEISDKEEETWSSILRRDGQRRDKKKKKVRFRL